MSVITLERLFLLLAPAAAAGSPARASNFPRSHGYMLSVCKRNQRGLQSKAERPDCIGQLEEEKLSSLTDVESL